MKKRISKIVVVFLVFLLLFFMSELNISLLSRSNLSYSSKSPGGGSLTLKHGRDISPTQSEGSITCDYSHQHYNLCSINGPTFLDPTTSTFFAMDTTNSTSLHSMVKTRPYPRKTDKTAMSRVKELTLTTSAPSKSPCTVAHTSPALVFSAGGYTGNFFHEFNEGFLPLYITVDSLFPDRDVNLVITNWQSWWARKYADLLPHFTRHPVINMDNQSTTHCFPSAIVGLIKHGPLVVDPTLLPHPKTLSNFHTFLKNVYIGGNKITRSNNESNSFRPQLVLVNRKGGVGREIMNIVEVIKEIKKVGFHVIVFEPKGNTPLVESYRLLYKSHAMLAVHGAAMTHLLFLRPGVVLGEIVPIGTEWPAQTYYEKPARVLGLQYMNYKITAEESSLADEYGINHLVLKDPSAFIRGNWTKTRVYMKTQNVKLDIVRFRSFLKNAFEKAKRFMDKEG